MDNYGWITLDEGYREVLQPQIGWRNAPKTGVVIHSSHLPGIGGGLELPEADVAARLALDAHTQATGGFALRTHQHVGREFARAQRGTWIADSMRLGKTACSLLAHSDTDGPLLIVAPLPARQVWIDWIAKAFPSRELVILSGRTYDREVIKNPDSKVFFLHYDILAAWQSIGLKIRFGTIIFDEVHVLSSPGARRTLGADVLASQADRVIGLSGTQMWNRVPGLWPILHLLAPLAWGTRYEFCQRYADPKLGEYGTTYRGLTNGEELRARMATLTIRRTWADIGEAPEISRTIEKVVLSEAQLFEAERAVAQAMSEQDAKVFRRFRRATAMAKIPRVVDLAEQVLRGGEHVVIWTWHRDIANELAKRIRKAGCDAETVTGDDSAVFRERTIAAWKLRPEPTALVLTMAVGQVAIDLSVARCEIFAELDYTPSVVAQAEMRPFRPGRSMAVTYVITNTRIEEKLVAILVDKCANANKLGVPAGEAAIDVLAAVFDVAAVDMSRFAESLSLDVGDELDFA